MILNRYKWVVAIFVIAHSLSAQQIYFQQEVNFKINVSLNDTANTLKAFEEVEYINNSNQGLSFIYFHLWPNAYKNNNTALAKQLLQHNKTDLYFSKPEERGYIDSLDFKVNGKSVKWEYDKEHIDICKLILNEPIKSLDTIKITTPFFVKIPSAKFSRLGHTGQAYFITQWYPKPAVFDNEGWHQMPYLDQGEFFSEFGSFDVSITLPQNYLLSATGDRIDAEEEEAFLNDNVIRTIQRLDRGDYNKYDMDFPKSSNKIKTVRFKQYRVHDFAWFADKRFNVLHDQIELPNTKRIVDTWVFFTNRNFELWRNAISYVNESTIFYSFLNGDYPYNNINAVDGTIMAGGGMEYPNVTVIGNMTNAYDLDITIAHEVGHNWFYGILGSNERDKPAMDEGLNSFYEMRYIRAKYPTRKLIEYIGLDSTFTLLGLNKTPYWREKEVAYFYSAKGRTDQPINTASQELSAFNYGSIIYCKTAVAFDYLMDYMGEENFDKAMQFYFDQFKFKHPSTTDLGKTLSYFSGIDLKWFIKHLIQTTDKIDYKIKSISRNKDGSFNLKIKNKTKSVVPFNIYAYKNNKPAGLVWSNGFEGNKTVGFPVVDADYFKIDGLDRMPDINRKNNDIKAKGLFKKLKPLQLSFITQFENPKKNQLNFLPVLGDNFYNGFMLGAAFHNYGLYQKKFEFLVSPMFAFNTMTPTGFAEFNYNLYPKKTFRQVTLGTKVKSFAYDYFNTKILNQNLSTNFKNQYYNFYKIAPYLQFELKKQNVTNSIYQYITYTNNNLFTDSLDTRVFPTYAVSGPRKKNTYSFVNELNYDLINHKAIHPYDLMISLQHNASMAKISGTFNYDITVSKTHYFSVRIFAGTFLAGTNSQKASYAFRMNGYNGNQDYLFANNFMARNEGNGLGFSQFSEQDGALKIWTPLGQTTEWLTAINIKSPRLFILPVRAYFDASVCDGRALLNEKVLWASGINVTLLKDIVEVYIPVAYSQEIKTVLELNNIDFWNRIRFTVNLHKLAPRNFIKNNLF